MLETGKLIEALKKGRERFPKRGHGSLWQSKGEPIACALGAIAVGLGYEPRVEEEDEDGYTSTWYDQENGYDFLNQYIPSTIQDRIWRINDQSFEYDYEDNTDIEIRNPDLAVMEFLKNLDISTIYED